MSVRQLPTTYARYGGKASHLYPAIGIENGVRTPDGLGTLLQAFSDGCMVVPSRGPVVAPYKGGKSYRPMRRYRPEDVALM